LNPAGIIFNATSAGALALLADVAAQQQACSVHQLLPCGHTKQRHCAMCLKHGDEVLHFLSVLTSGHIFFLCYKAPAFPAGTSLSML
jgi:hypothetical protein